jgi:hypothetical protein
MAKAALRAWHVVVLGVLGAVVGTVGDQIHVQYGVLWYPAPRPWLYGQAAWVPALFGGSTIALVFGHALLVRAWPPARRPQRRAVVAPFLLFAAAYFSTGLFQAHPAALALGLTLAWAARVALAPARDKLAAGVLYAFAGPLVEAAVSSLGGFYYRHPSAVRVPLWLPALYLHVSLLSRHIYLAWFAPPLDVHARTSMHA